VRKALEGKFGGDVVTANKAFVKSAIAELMSSE
jgi:hypothetical protein